MSNDKTNQGNIDERIWKLKTTINKMVMDMRRNPYGVAKALQSFAGDSSEEDFGNAYQFLSNVQTAIDNMIQDGTCDRYKFAEVLQGIVDHPTKAISIRGRLILVKDWDISTDSSTGSTETDSIEKVEGLLSAVELLPSWFEPAKNITVMEPFEVYKSIGCSAFSDTHHLLDRDLNALCFGDEQARFFIEKYASKIYHNSRANRCAAHKLFTKRDHSVYADRNNIGTYLLISEYKKLNLYISRYEKFESCDVLGGTFFVIPKLT